MGAKALPVAAVPEQTIIAFVRDDVVDSIGRRIAAWVSAIGMGDEVGSAGLAPLIVVATICR
jgi:hypothetical protein